MSYLAGKLDESKLATWWNNTVSWWNDKIINLKAIFTCPVSVSILDASGNQIGYVGEDDIWYAEELIYIEEKGDAKIIYSFMDEAPTFVLNASDYGTLGCSIEEYDDEGQPTERTNFYDIDLYPGKRLSAENHAGAYTISSDGASIAADEKILSDQDASVTVACNASTGGETEGAGTYVRGDAVVLLARPQDGYRFIGWYNANDILIETNSCFEFTAKENTFYAAKFANETLSESLGDANGNGRVDFRDAALVLRYDAQLIESFPAQ